MDVNYILTLKIHNVFLIRFYILVPFYSYYESKASLKKNVSHII